jgi:hypothetical protein
MLYHLVYTIDLNIQTFGLGACICSQTACYVRVCVCAGPKVLGFEGFVWGLWREKKKQNISFTGHSCRCKLFGGFKIISSFTLFF